MVKRALVLCIFINIPKRIQTKWMLTSHQLEWRPLYCQLENTLRRKDALSLRTCSGNSQSAYDGSKVYKDQEELFFRSKVDETMSTPVLKTGTVH
ncbi:hypothetical protein HOLleu_22947 [Holothuria leucospilota]|uniref:Uncharacterized protein n=1 Tax=Holothuria leucospilota TaxID=206669 RepID=A0A9Q1BU82_HOLLE|nr:hypothetical protein HOLleu_22947 [Holothuria leucospilota]